MMPRGRFHTDQSGRKFSKLTLLKMLDEKTGNGSFKYLCKCDCGNETIVGFNQLSRGNTKSCGCLSYRTGKESPNYIHGKSKTKDYELNFQMKRNYGISLDEYYKLVKKQNGVCAICKQKQRAGRKTRLSVDHCHTTGKVRGLLCDTCNRSIGLLKDNIDVLQNAIQYLKQSLAR
jgi:hypothetical protein